MREIDGSKLEIMLDSADSHAMIHDSKIRCHYVN